MSVLQNSGHTYRDIYGILVCKKKKKMIKEPKSLSVGTALRMMAQSPVEYNETDFKRGIFVCALKIEL